jgi:hypothetical protein
MFKNCVQFQNSSFSSPHETVSQSKQCTMCVPSCDIFMLRLFMAVTVQQTNYSTSAVDAPAQHRQTIPNGSLHSSSRPTKTRTTLGALLDILHKGNSIYFNYIYSHLGFEINYFAAMTRKCSPEDIRLNANKVAVNKISFHCVNAVDTRQHMNHR